MAFRRSLSERAIFVARQCHRPSVSHLLRRHDSDADPDHDIPNRGSHNLSTLFQNRRLCSGAAKLGFSNALGSYRHMSTTIDDGSDKFGIIIDQVISDSASAKSQVAAVNEVAIAAADSFYPVQWLQYVIDAVHTYAGVNWWAAIALTTLIIRGSSVPLLINQLKSTTKLSLMRPRMEELKEQMQSGTLDTYEGQREMSKLFKEHGVTPFTPLKGLLIQGPVFVSFFLAISNMAEKVPSFKVGGAYWFVDLTTPDPLYVFPVLTALTFLITVECNMQEGMEGNPVAGTMKKFSRIFAVLTVPFTMSFPKAIFCYWITSNLFSLAYGLVIKRPAVKKYLNIPTISVTPTSTGVIKNAKPFSFSDFFAQLKETAQKQAELAARAQASQTSKPVVEHSKTSLTSASVISQRLKTLEKQIKGKKNKKRL